VPAAGKIGRVSRASRAGSTRLREALVADGRTQKEVAKAAGVSPGTLCIAANGTGEPGVFAAMRIARALGKTVEDIFNV